MWSAPNTNLRLSQRRGDIVGVPGVALAAREADLPCRKRQEAGSTCARLVSSTDDGSRPPASLPVPASPCRPCPQQQPPTHHPPLCVLSLGLRWLRTTCTSPLAGSSKSGTSTAANRPVSHTGGAVGAALQDARRFLTTRSNRYSSAAVADVPPPARVCTMSAGVQATDLLLAPPSPPLPPPPLRVSLPCVLDGWARWSALPLAIAAWLAGSWRERSARRVRRRPARCKLLGRQARM